MVWSNIGAWIPTLSAVFTPTYIFRADWDRSDVAFTNGQVLDDDATEGVQTGSATAIKAAGTTNGITSNQWRIANTAVVWAQAGAYLTSGATLSNGLCMLTDFQNGTTATFGLYLTLCDSSGGGSTAPIVMFGGDSSNIMLVNGRDAAGAQNVWRTYAQSWAASTAYKAAIVAGGFTSGRVPWTGGVGTFVYGTNCFFNDGSSWRLVGFGPTFEAPATVYPTWESLGAQNSDLNDTKVATDLSDVIDPTQIGAQVDLFSDTGSTNLTSHTPDVGSTWTVAGGGMQIDSGGTACENTSGDWPECVVDIGTAEVIVVAEVTTPGTAVGGGGVTVRSNGSASQGYFVMLDDSANVLRIYELPSFTVRASSAFSSTVSSNYGIVVAANGNTVSGSVARWDSTSAGVQINYTSSTYNTNQYHGGKLGGGSSGYSGMKIEHIAIKPVTHSLYDTRLDAV